jgi:hypothetical protein
VYAARTGDVLDRHDKLCIRHDGWLGSARNGRDGVATPEQVSAARPDNAGRPELDGTSRPDHTIRPDDSAKPDGVTQPESTSKPNGSKQLSGTSKPDAGRGVTAIGDSVMLDIAPYLQNLLPGITIDGKVGRQMSQAKDIIEGRARRRCHHRARHERNILGEDTRYPAALARKHSASCACKHARAASVGTRRQFDLGEGCETVFYRDARRLVHGKCRQRFLFLTGRRPSRRGRLEGICFTYGGSDQATTN